MSATISAPITATQTIALLGNPNTGKTSIFNALTGLKQRVGNYPGVTVEKKTGHFSVNENKIQVVDLPGLYSLIPKSPDDKISADVLLGRRPALQVDLAVVVVDAGNLSRNLYLLTQVLDFEIPVICALNMMDVAEKNGIQIDLDKLSAAFNITFVPVVANKGTGIDTLKFLIDQQIQATENQVPKRLVVDDELQAMISPLTNHLETKLNLSTQLSEKQALRIASSDLGGDYVAGQLPLGKSQDELSKIKRDVRKKIRTKGDDWSMLETKLRYAWIETVMAETVVRKEEKGNPFSEKVDQILTHRIFGPIIFIAIFALIFQTIFSWAQIPMDAIDAGIEALKVLVTDVMPAGVLRDMVVDGAIAGVGAVVIFLPQILFLFFFLGVLEDTGYMARAAFMMDKIMRSMGLSGRSVIPMLSSFACAIPGIMATRTISNWKERLITIMIAPFMSCSARMPVYVLMIGAFIPDKSFLGIISYSAITLLAMYMLGIVTAMAAAFVFKNFILKTETASSSFVLELPPYRRPSLKWTAMQMVERAKVFVTDAGQIILAMSVILWALAAYPKVDTPAGPVSDIEHSYAGQIGHFMEPAIEPLGFDWKIGISLLTSFAAREVMVSTMATIYSVEDGETSVDLLSAMRNDTHPETGKPRYSALMAISLMVFFVLACQCMATVAIVKRETNSWRWPAIMVVYMTGLAYIVSLIVFQTGLLLGFA